MLIIPVRCKGIWLLNTMYKWPLDAMYQTLITSWSHANSPLMQRFKIACSHLIKVKKRTDRQECVLNEIYCFHSLSSGFWCHVAMYVATNISEVHITCTFTSLQRQRWYVSPKHSHHLQDHMVPQPRRACLTVCIEDCSNNSSQNMWW
jgi:hypothetical protein